MHSPYFSNLLEAIRSRLESLNRSERKVAEVILKDPQSATRASIATLAQAAGVSEPTVNRFCRSFSAKGFPDFKLQLAQSLASGTPYVGQNVESEDGPEEYVNKIFAATVQALEHTRQRLDPTMINKAVDYLIQAKQIMFFGLGASGPVAYDAQHKFFRFNIPVSAYDDVLMMRMVSSAAHRGDMIVIISYTGRTRELVEIAQIARETGATVLGITTPDSPLAKQCTLSLPVSPDENTDIYMPMSSRIVHLAMLDVLSTGVILRRGVDFHAHLKKIKDSLKDTRYPSED
ncbi:transcriptional regulator [Pokkaliibacter plantistimulans]|uniref:Transcriptional regulator n=1 Tax=Pokkaliibacter plantistimulans TaxID=1635171 RepID=A0ABX5M5R3_9GAMM|nr:MULTISPECIES: MurR/RpiR family transcriptional regulator [Pokkaliibacter]MDH2434537.1 MurR/RpiR family transcriptional regulator [Pokkaliibacter sp. MBI-7]PXF32938.1 transcriptional regulator [Pokkaliibacter plantistimulans]